MSTKRINLCTPTIRIGAEAERKNGITLEYQCVKAGFMVAACKWYSPLVGAGGLVCPGECRHFRQGCRCRAARMDARKRAYRLVESKIRSARA